MGKSQAEVARMLGVNPKTIGRWERGFTSFPPYLGDALKSQLVHEQMIGDFTFIDLFAGIGGTRLGFESVGGQCIFTAEWDKFARKTYIENFGIDEDHQLVGDVTNINASDVPDHDVLLAGFPCQPFSIAGVSKKNSLGRPHGFDDETQGTLFFDVARIIGEKRPRAFMLENVRNLVSHDKGRTFQVITRTLSEKLGYHFFFKVLDASPFVPQGRKRIIMVGFNHDNFAKAPHFDFNRLSAPGPKPTMRSILHPEDGSEVEEPPYTSGKRGKVIENYTLTPRLWDYLQNYAIKHRQAGNGFGFGLVGPDDVARTLSARYYKDGSEVLVSRGKGKIPRRLTPRECARLMGFPDNFRIPVSDTQAYRQFGNSVVVPLISSVAELMLPFVDQGRNKPASGMLEARVARPDLEFPTAIGA
jgi:DNA (cytosine-5)-methyltransferase 1